MKVHQSLCTASKGKGPIKGECICCPEIYGEQGNLRVARLHMKVHQSLHTARKGKGPIMWRYRLPQLLRRAREIVGTHENASKFIKSKESRGSKNFVVCMLP